MVARTSLRLRSDTAWFQQAGGRQRSGHLLIRSHFARPDGYSKTLGSLHRPDRDRRRPKDAAAARTASVHDLTARRAELERKAVGGGLKLRLQLAQDLRVARAGLAANRQGAIEDFGGVAIAPHLEAQLQEPGQAFHKAGAVVAYAPAYAPGWETEMAGQEESLTRVPIVRRVWRQRCPRRGGLKLVDRVLETIAFVIEEIWEGFNQAGQFLHPVSVQPLLGALPRSVSAPVGVCGRLEEAALIDNPMDPAARIDPLVNFQRSSADRGRSAPARSA